MLKVSANGIRMPIIPAPPNSSAYTDQQKEAATARLTSVSMVAAAWPSPLSAVRCSGQAPHPATGAASSRLTHCQPVNCAAGTIERMITTTASGARRQACGPGPGRRVGDVLLVLRRRGSAAWYPVELITLMNSGASRPPRLVK